MGGHRPYHRCTAITSQGRRCLANSLYPEQLCIKHLPATDPRRVAYFADLRRRQMAYYARLRAEKAAQQAA